MKRTGLIVTLVIALVAFVCGFGGVTTALLVTQPAASAHVAVEFSVNQGDLVATVASNLQAAGLICNALAFRLLAKVRKAVFQQGTYTLYPDMTMDAIIGVLENGAPVPQVSILIPPGMRVTQYPTYSVSVKGVEALKDLPNFKASDFLKIATTGNFLDGTPVNTDFWFVPAHKAKNVVYALEGYLRPDTYEFYASDDATAVIKFLLTEFGNELCPGSATYLTNEAQCKANPVKIAGKSIFTLLEQKYGTSNDQLALYEALTIASIAEREVTGQQKDIQAVTNVLYNRYLNNLGKYPNPPNGSPNQLEADPTVQYARDTDHPPANGAYWQPLQPPASGPSGISPTNPYNTYVAPGLPPGPISAPEWVNHMPAAINVSTSQYFYYWASCQNKVNVWHYAVTNSDFQAGLNQYGAATC